MKLSNSPRAIRAGFTLIELLTVISIIVVLMALSIGAGTLAVKRSHVNKCKVQVKSFERALEEYKADNGVFPPGDGSERSSNDLFIALYENGITNDSKVYLPELDPKSSDQFKIKQGLIMDPFKKNPYFYLRGLNENGEQNESAYNPDFDLWSLGPNGVGRGKGGDRDEDTADDITNWN